MQFEAYAYLNIDHPVTAWATAVGRIDSVAQIAQAEGRSPLSLCMATLMHSKDYVRLHNEWIIEAVRAKYFPSSVSRLSGLFVFDDADSALSVLAADWGGHFIGDYLADVDVIPSRFPTRVDSNWITYAPLIRGAQALDVSDLGWIIRYWAGEAYPHASKPIWEVLVDGSLSIRQSPLRGQAYARAMEEFPESEFYLTTACMAARAGSDAGQVSAWVLEHPHSLEICFALKEGPLHEPDTINRIVAVGTSAEIKKLRQTPEQFRVPDLRHLFVSLPKPCLAN